MTALLSFFLLCSLPVATATGLLCVFEKGVVMLAVLCVSVTIICAFVTFVKNKCVFLLPFSLTLAVMRNIIWTGGQKYG